MQYNIWDLQIIELTDRVGMGENLLCIDRWLG